MTFPKNANVNFLQNVINILNRYVSDSEKGVGIVLKQQNPQKLAKELELISWIQKGGMNPAEASNFLKEYLENTQHMHHPGYMGHQVAIPHLGSAIADLIHGSINNPMAIYEMGPAGATMEQTLVNWMLSKTGWINDTHALDNYNLKSHTSGGVFTHGGSLANLTALLAARAKIAPDSWENGTPNNVILICSEVAHYAIARAASIIGIGSKSIVSVPVNEREVMKVDLLAKIIIKCKSEGKQIMAVVGNACATSTGLYDPLFEIGRICHSQNIWFHIDGAHGASALISEKYKHLMKGIEFADSLVWDAHKMLRTSSLCAAILFKDRKNMERMFRQKGSYLFHDKDEPGFDLMPYTIECTKSGLASKLFWVLALEGEKGLGNFISDLYDRAKDFYKFINSQSDFIAPYMPESNILCFKYLHHEDQLEIRKILISEGNFYISTAEINKIRYLRIVIMNPLTNLIHLKRLLEEIRRIN